MCVTSRALHRCQTAWSAPKALPPQQPLAGHQQTTQGVPQHATTAQALEGNFKAAEQLQPNYNWQQLSQQAVQKGLGLCTCQVHALACSHDLAWALRQRWRPMLRNVHAVITAVHAQQLVQQIIHSRTMCAGRPFAQMVKQANVSHVSTDEPNRSPSKQSNEFATTASATAPQLIATKPCPTSSYRCAPVQPLPMTAPSTTQADTSAVQSNTTKPRLATTATAKAGLRPLLKLTQCAHASALMCCSAICCVAAAAAAAKLQPLLARCPHDQRHRPVHLIRCGVAPSGQPQRAYCVVRVQPHRLQEKRRHGDEHTAAARTQKCRYGARLVPDGLS